MRGVHYGRGHGPPLLLREARVAPLLLPPRDVAIRILEQRYGRQSGANPEADVLASFQRDAVVRARAMLARRGGVLVADSVGLGKTHVALALIEPFLDAGRGAVVVGPAALRQHWRAASRAAPGLHWLSYSRLARGGRPPVDCEIAVFDEAHALRNPRTRRYRAAAALCRDTRVVLLTATPVNNSIWDLYHLLRLFSGDRDYLDAGVASLRSAFEEAESCSLLGTAPSIQPVLRAVVIRRTRPLLRELSRGRSPEQPEYPPGLRFPENRPPIAVRYALAAAGAPDALRVVGDALPHLVFPAHRPGGRPRDARESTSRGTPPAALMRVGLLKRLESSVAAFERSLASYEALLERCLDGLSRGILIHARDDPDRGGGGDVQLTLELLLYEPVPPGFPVERHRSDLRRELECVRAMRSALAPALASDGKLNALVSLLARELRGRRVLLFTQFRDTARYLHARLARRFRVALVDGSHARLGCAVVDRSAVVRRFAPLANGAAAPAEHERVDVLVATDVLSEGFNLQDADVVISYDLPWNPVRLVQRIGRIDRLGSPHAAVASYHFLPGELERYLGLLDRIALKASAIDASVGSDMPALHAELVRALDRRDPAVLQRIEASEAEWFELDERLMAALAQATAAESTPAGVSPTVTTPAGAAPCTARQGEDDDLPIGLLTPSGGGTPSGLVAAVVGGRFEWVAVRNGRAVADDVTCARLVERALHSPRDCISSDDLPGRLDAVLDGARVVFARRAATAATAALLPAGGEASRLGRRLLAMAAALPGGPDPTTCARLERCLECLASLPEASLAILPRPRLDAASLGDSLTRLLEAIESLPTGRSSVDRPERTAARSAAPADRAVRGATRDGPPFHQAVRLVGVLLEGAPRR